MACVGQLDVDPTVDVWSVSTAERRAADGTPIQAGTAVNDVNDVKY
jgi:hypothetical protein